MIRNKKTSKFFYFLFIASIFLIVTINPIAGEEFFKDYTVQHLTQGEIVLNEAPSIAVYNHTVHVVWNTWPEEFNCSLYYIRSLDNGRTWSNRTTLGFDNSTGIDSVVGINENIIHVAWKDSQNGNPEIYYSKSNDTGNNWSSPKRLTFNNSLMNNIYDLSLEVEDNNVYIMWKDYRSGSSEIFIKISTDNGDTWSDDQRLTFDYNPSYYPSFEVKNNNIFVVYEDRGEFYNLGFFKSIDTGNSWSEIKHLTNTEDVSEKPDLTISDNVLYLVWQEEISDYNEIFFKKSNDFGETWSQTQQLTNDKTTSVNPKTYVYDDMVIVIWRAQVDNEFLIFYKISYDAGETWSENQQLASDEGCHNAELAGEGSSVYIVWQKYYEGAWADIMYMGSYNYTGVVISSINQQSSDAETPGFESTTLIGIIAIFSVLYLINKRKRR